MESGNKHYRPISSQRAAGLGSLSRQTSVNGESSAASARIPKGRHQKVWEQQRSRRGGVREKRESRDKDGWRLSRFRPYWGGDENLGKRLSGESESQFILQYFLLYLLITVIGCELKREAATRGGQG